MSKQCFVPSTILQLYCVSRRYRDMLQASVHTCRAAVLSFDVNPCDSIAALAREGVLQPTTAGIADFLFQSHKLIPAKAVGKYLARPTRREEDDPTGAQSYDICTAYLRKFDFADDTPTQAMRKLLIRTRMPPGYRRWVYIKPRYALQGP